MSTETYHVVNSAGEVVRTIEVDEALELSDGHHTFGELYAHRRALTALIAAAASTEGDSWRSKAHHPDGDPMFPGYFIVGIELPTGTITYHYRLKYWDDFAAVMEIDHAPRWDGHTPADTVDRLLATARLVHEAQEG